MVRESFISTLLRRTHALPVAYDRALAVSFIDNLFQFLFIPRSAALGSEAALREELANLRGTCSSLLFDILGSEADSERVTSTFFDALPEIYDALLKDAAAIVAFDPAAGSLEEVLAAYPGFYATAIYRFAHRLYRAEVPVLPRFLSEYAHGRTGIDIHPGAVIGESFFIDHGTGIVIGQSTVIGNNVKLYQGVTLGALSTTKESANTKRHPDIGNNVIIYAGATILGGETVVGDNSIIGGNVWLTYSVAPDSIVYHQSNVVIKGRQPLPEPLNFVI